jgi:hypothetical protein
VAGNAVKGWLVSSLVAKIAQDLDVTSSSSRLSHIPMFDRVWQIELTISASLG